MTRLAIFSDFDGTITTKDTGVILIDSAMGQKRRKQLDSEILNSQTTFRDAVKEMWNSVQLSSNDALELLKDVEFDPHFKEFHDWVTANQYEFHVLSSGVDVLLVHFFNKLLGTVPKLTANKIKMHSDGWEIVYFDDSDHGHDKGKHLRKLRNDRDGDDPKIVFIGDGVSDISCAKEADILFAKRGKDLEKWCISHKVPYIAWDDFSQILSILQA